MSGFSTRTTAPTCRTYGPAKASRLSLMGIRFLTQEEENNGGGGGGNDGAKPVTFATQADLDRVITERVNRAKEPFKDFETFKEKAGKFDKLSQDQLSDGEKVTQRLTELENRATTAETAVAPLQLQLLRYEVAAAKKLDLIHAPRLQGATKEDIEKDADLFISTLGVTSADKVRRADPGQGGRDEEIVGSKGKSEAERRFGDKAKK